MVYFPFILTSEADELDAEELALNKKLRIIRLYIVELTWSINSKSSETEILLNENSLLSILFINKALSISKPLFRRNSTLDFLYGYLHTLWVDSS